MAAKQFRTEAVTLGVVIGIVGAAGFFLLTLGAQVGWVPLQASCIERPDCFPAPGETLISVLAGERLLVDRARYWLLQNQRAPDDRTSPPLLYTHNANLAAFLYYFASVGGARDPLRAIVVLAVVAFAGGLFYAWAFTREFTKSSLFGLLFLFFLATEHHFNLLFGLNALRAWHWIGLFGACFHLVRFVRSGRRLDEVAFIVWVFVAFQIGYDFFAVAVCSLLGLLMLLRLTEPGMWRHGRVRQIAWLMIFATTTPVILRQVQVVGALGWEFWAKDLYYTAVIKTPIASNMPLPSLDEINEFYRRHHVVRNVASPSQGVFKDLEFALGVWRDHWRPFLGRVQWEASLAGLVAAAVWLARSQRRVSSSFVEVSGSPGRSEEDDWSEGMRNAGAVLVVVGGQVTGLFLFLPFAIHFWIRYAFPLLIAGLMLSLAFGCWAAIQLLRGSVSEVRRGGVRSLRGAIGVLLAGAFLVAVISDHSYRQLQSYSRWVFLPAEESAIAQERILRTLQTYGAETS